MTQSPFVRYTRAPALAFTVLHVVTAVVAAALGWAVRAIAAARIFTLALGISYGVLGTGGWFTDGLFLDSAVTAAGAAVAVAVARS